MVYVWIRSLNVNDSKVPAQAQAHTISDSAPLQPAFKMLLFTPSSTQLSVVNKLCVVCYVPTHSRILQHNNVWVKEPVLSSILGFILRRFPARGLM